MNIFLVNLVVVDIMMVVFVVFGYVVFCNSRYCSYFMFKYCWLMVGLKDVVFVGIVLNLVVILFDRFFVVLWFLCY